MSVDFGEQAAQRGTPWFNASLHSSPDRLLVCLTGELDLCSDAAIRAVFDKIAGQAAPVTVVDLSKVTFIDAHSIGLIAGAYRSAVDRGQVLGVVGLRGVVADLFTLFNLEVLFLEQDVAVLDARPAHESEGDLGGQG